MAIRAGEVCLAHPELLSDEARAMMDAGQSPLHFDELHFVWSRKQSLKLLDRQGPALVLAGSGFCDAGPILHHLEQHLCHERGHVVFTGYVLPGSLAEGLANGTARRVRINGTEMDVRARISRLHGLSGHAHMDDLAQWLVSDGHSPELVLLNHGDDAARTGAGERISSLVESDIGLPGLLDPIQIA
jgi:metallo-beta-lactamase family protein